MDKSRRFYNYVGSTYAEIYVKFATFYGDIALHFPLFHSLTRCDTRSYYHCHGKTIPWNCNIKSGFKLTYRDSGNTIHFSFFMSQFLSPGQKITISKHNIYKKGKRVFSYTAKRNLLCCYH